MYCMDCSFAIPADDLRPGPRCLECWQKREQEQEEPADRAYLIPTFEPPC